jgi:pyridinium-3,5-bisthiocarboxylic acid mononucleotide nickel chelatase
MVLGALLDAGLPADALRAELGKLPCNGYAIEIERVTRQGIAGTQVTISDRTSGYRGNGSGSAHLAGRESWMPQEKWRGTPDVRQTIARSVLSEQVKQRALTALELLGEAENAVHGYHRADLYETPGVTSLVEIVGAIAGLSLLGVERVECSPLNVGSGSPRTANGILPALAPATAEILRNAAVPLYGTEVDRALVTPTGAAIIVALASAFGPMPMLTIDKVGYGAGRADTAGNPYLLRATIGDFVAQPEASPLYHRLADSGLDGTDVEVVSLIEANLHDGDPQYYDSVMQHLRSRGAIHAHLVPVRVEQNRPGALLSVLCKPEQVDALAALIFEEIATATLAVSEVSRRMLQRHTADLPSEDEAAPVPGISVPPADPEDDETEVEQPMPIEFVGRASTETHQIYGLDPSDSHQRIGRQRNAKSEL